MPQAAGTNSMPMGGGGGYPPYPPTSHMNSFPSYPPMTGYPHPSPNVGVGGYPPTNSYQVIFLFILKKLMLIKFILESNIKFWYNYRGAH